MPYIEVMIEPAPSDAQAESLAQGITDAMVTIMGKRREVTAVHIVGAKSHLWLIGGEKSSAPTAYVDVKITEGSNTAEQKAELIAHLNRLLDETLGGLAEASYIVVHELPGANWGYAGRTQAERFGAL